MSYMIFNIYLNIIYTFIYKTSDKIVTFPCTLTRHLYHHIEFICTRFGFLHYTVVFLASCLILLCIFSVQHRVWYLESIK